jgi:hypothetical protein
MTDLDNAEPIDSCNACGTELYLINEYSIGDPARLLGRVTVDLMSKGTLMTKWAHHDPERCIWMRNRRAS